MNEQTDNQENNIPELTQILIQKNLEVLIEQCESNLKIQKKKDQAIEKNEKVDRNLIFQQNMQQTQVFENLQLILPLLKQDSFLNKQIEDTTAPYTITDPIKRETINELKEYIKEISAEDEKDETPKQKEAREIQKFRDLIFETKKKKPQE